MTKKKGRANEIDKVIGLLIKAKRKEAGLSQEKIAQALDITFQQVQKYESGVNRISAGNLHLLAEFLGLNALDLMPPQRYGQGINQELLEALESIPLDCEHSYPHLLACWKCKAQAAIKKAKGGA